MNKTTHQRLVQLWSDANNIPGSKRRMEGMGHLYTSVKYMVNTPTYQDQEKMELVIQCLKQISSEHRTLVVANDDNIQAI